MRHRSRGTARPWWHPRAPRPAPAERALRRCAELPASVQLWDGDEAMTQLMPWDEASLLRSRLWPAEPDLTGWT